jgi:hypothetical protein
VKNMARFHARKILLHAANLRHETDGFNFPPKEVVLRIFITLKNPSSSAGFEPANLGSSGKHPNTRPQRKICKINQMEQEKITKHEGFRISSEEYVKINNINS